MRLHGAGGARISIHVPLAGDDVQDADLAKRSVSISIHVPLAGDDPLILFTAGKGVDFYPRPPCGGRRTPSTRSSPATNFYPRPPCGGRRAAGSVAAAAFRISIHVPLAGDDLPEREVRLGAKRFLSTSPLRGTTVQTGHDGQLSVYFYPRPPCGGRPDATFCAEKTLTDFYPRPPCGGRQLGGIHPQHAVGFLSTSPLRGTTCSSGRRRCRPPNFYPRPPCGGRHTVRAA